MTCSGHAAGPGAAEKLAVQGSQLSQELGVCISQQKPGPPARALVLGGYVNPGYAAPLHPVSTLPFISGTPTRTQPACARRPGVHSQIGPACRRPPQHSCPLSQPRLQQSTGNWQSAGGGMEAVLSAGDLLTLPLPDWSGDAQGLEAESFKQAGAPRCRRGGGPPAPGPGA